MDVAGRLVDVLADGPAGPGTAEATWRGSGGARASGIYFVRLSLDGGVVRPVRRLLFMP